MRLFTSVFPLVLLLRVVVAKPIAGESDSEALAERQLPFFNGAGIPGPSGTIEKRADASSLDNGTKVTPSADVTLVVNPGNLQTPTPSP